MVHPPPTYHLVGKVAIGFLQLGTIIGDIRDPMSLNEDEEPEIAQSRRHCLHEAKSATTRDELLQAGAEIAAKAASLEGVGGKAKLERGSSFALNYQFESIDTLSFNPTLEDYLQAVQASGVQAFLRSSKYRPVYMITGLKIGRHPTSTSLTSNTKTEGQLEAGVHLESALSLGPGLGASKSVTVTQKSEESSDYVFAIKVRKLQYRKPYFGLFGPGELADAAYNAGAELVGVDNTPQAEEQAVFDVEELDLDHEVEQYHEVKLG